MSESRPAEDGTTTTTRLEAFSDGVFAIAVTLLVLEIKVPHGTPEGGLARALLAQWPSYVAFVISFSQVGIIWANHHAVMDHVRRADRGLLMVTLFLLLVVSFIPFPTEVLADHLAGPPGPDRTAAALFFGGAYVLMALAFHTLWRYIRRADLLHDPAHPGVQAITRSFRFGPLIYLLVTLLALVSVPASVAASAALAVYWAWPGSSGTYRAPGAARGRPGGGAAAA